MAIGYVPSSSHPSNMTNAPHTGAGLPWVIISVLSCQYSQLSCSLFFPSPLPGKTQTAFSLLASGRRVTREHGNHTDLCPLQSVRKLTWLYKATQPASYVPDQRARSLPFSLAAMSRFLYFPHSQVPHPDPSPTVWSPTSQET